MSDSTAKDPELEAFVQHIRDTWPQRQVLHKVNPVPRDHPDRGNQEFEDHLRRATLAELHKIAAERDLMILAVDGPSWKPRDHIFDVLELRAVGLPRWQPPRDMTRFQDQRLAEQQPRPSG